MDIRPFTSAALQKHLEEHILPFWMNRMPDELHGGFYGRIDGYNKTHQQADKGVILNTRILWTFAAAYRKLGNPAYFSTATQAFGYLTKYFVDPEYGGMYWMVDYRGNPEIQKKQVYAQSFAIYALAEYYLATRNEQSLDLAIGLFRLIEQHTWDSIHEGYIEAVDRNWKPLTDMRLSEKDLNAPKSMNTHLHILEAYTNFDRALKSEVLKGSLSRLILVMCEKFVRKDGHFSLFFSLDWKSLTSEYSFGHDIEGSWLIWDAMEVLGDKHYLREYRQLVLRMIRAALEGFDEDGGLMNEGEDDQVTDSDKHWWPQAETLVGLINAWQMTGDDFYYLNAEKVWQFIQSYLVDYENGEWFWRVNRKGVIIYEEDKAGPWKCPYHNGRAMLELMGRLV